MKNGTDDLAREEKLSILKDCLSHVGRKIDNVVAWKHAHGLDGEKWRKHLWV